MVPYKEKVAACSYSKMPPTTGDLIRLTDHEASVQHNQAVSRDYISQPRLGNEG